MFFSILNKQKLKLIQSTLNTNPIRGQHVLRLLFFLLDVHLKGVPVLKELLEQRQLLPGCVGGGRRLSARGHGWRATLAHELELLDQRE